MTRTVRRRAPSRQPAAESELALLLVGTRQRREAASGRIAELAAAVDEDELAQFLIQQRVLLLAGGRLVDLAPASMSASFRERLAAAYTSARTHARAFSVLTRRVVQALEGASVAAIALKGPTLAAELYGDEALREYLDIDILVTRADLDRATALTRALGWTDADESGRVPRLHRALRDPGASLPDVELHWRIHWYETRFAAGLLERSRFADGLRRLDPFDELAALLLFYARDGFAGLRHAADIAAWWDSHGSPAVPIVLEGLMAAHPALAEPWRAALAAVAPVAGLPQEAVPAGCQPRRRRSTLAVRLTNWDLRGDVDQIHANVTLIDGLLAPRRDIPAFVSRQVLRPTRVTPATHGLPLDSLARAFTDRALHLGKLVARYALALWQLHRAGHWSPTPFPCPGSGSRLAADRACSSSKVAHP